MNTSTTKRSLAALSVVGVTLFGAVACGTETVPETDPGINPAPVSKKHDADGRRSADSSERKAAQEKARQDSASTARWDRSVKVQERVDRSGHPGQP